MSKVKAVLTAAAVLVALSGTPATAGMESGSASPSMPELVQRWQQDAESDPVAARGLAEFQHLTAAEQSRFLDLLHDSELWEQAIQIASSTPGPGVYRVTPDVEMVVHETQQLRPAGDGTSTAPLQLWNVTTTSKIDFKILGIKLGHWKQEYGYTTKTGQYSIVSSDWCNGWWTGFSGFWNISSSTTHYKSGDFGYCKTLHAGGLVFKGSFIKVNKEHGQKVAGPSRVSYWLKNV